MKTSNLAVETKSAVNRKKATTTTNEMGTNELLLQFPRAEFLWASVTIKTIVSHAFIFSIRLVVCMFQFQCEH